MESKVKQEAFIRRSLLFTEDPDSYWAFLQDFYLSVISEESWPQDTLRSLHSGFEQILATLEIAWLKHKKHMNWQQHRKHKNADGNSLGPSFSDYSPEEYFPFLQENRWPAERFRRYGRGIRLLNQQEISSRHLVYEQFYGYQSYGDWMRNLAFWLEAATEKRSIFSSGEFSPAQLHRHYFLLLKVTERVWLEAEHDSGLLYHEVMPWYDLNNYPVFGTSEYCLNPYNQIYGCFHSKSLMDYKKDLDRWMKVVVHSDSLWQGKPAELLLLFRTFVLIADCLWLIRQLGANYPKQWNKSYTRYAGECAAVPDRDYQYRLSRKLRKKPENYLKVFFDEYSLNDVFRLFFCTVNHAVPRLVFLWKDKGTHFSLKIRVKIFNKLYHLNDKCYLDFFVTTRDAPSEFLLLSTVDECRLVRFFNESHFQMIILKSHYTGEIVEFIERLRQLYEFRG